MKKGFYIKGLYYVHDAIKRDTIFIEKFFDEFAVNQSEKLPKLMKWYRKYWLMMDIHHKSEENIFFKYVLKKDKKKQELIEELKSEHRNYDILMIEIEDLIQKLADEEKDFSVILHKLQSKISVLKDHILKHAEDEEVELVQSIEKHYNYKQQKKIEKKIHFYINFRHIPYLVAWMGDGLNQRDYRDYIENMPYIVKFLYRNFWIKSYLKLKSQIL